MKYIINSLVLFCSFLSLSIGQVQVADSGLSLKLDEVTVTANRFPVLLKNNPGSASLVTTRQLSSMPKAIAAEEALRLVPGVRIDNQHDGERIHLSIRGQGILTERGLRGISVFLDGIPLNDPSGFAPDLYDVDWSTIRKIEVLRGPVAGLYGASSSGGVLNISTRDGGPRPLSGSLSQGIGTNGFLRTGLELNGSKGATDYRLSYTHGKGDGYRDHQAFHSDKLYEKLNFHPSEKLSLTQVISHTSYFQQNPEGLNLGQFDDLRQANPDARPFNEYQRTDRTTLGVHGRYSLAKNHELEFSSYLRNWNYKETSNRCAEYRSVNNPGASLQYNLHLATGSLRHHLGIGADLKFQDISMYKLQSAADPNREESTDETNLETDSLLANQLIIQQNTGIYALYKLDAGKFNLMGNIRYDELGNKLRDKMMGGDTATTHKDFSNLSLRIGASYELTDHFTLFASWSQGFIPPSTEELASNPEGYSGFNTHLVQATSGCVEAGIRSYFGEKLYVELTGFLMNTENDFFRFKQSGRGNQEVFYGNAGNSDRKGVETYISWKVTEKLSLQAAYTYADYRYTSATVDPVYTDPAYVLTTPPAEGQWLPNSPRHQLYAEATALPMKNLELGLGMELQSKWAIYTDAHAYNGDLDPAIYQNWQDGFRLFHVRATYQWKIGVLQGECSLFIRNLTGESYMAFTEPDPDGNAYQPGPGREIFGNIVFRF